MVKFIPDFPVILHLPQQAGEDGAGRLFSPAYAGSKGSAFSPRRAVTILPRRHSMECTH